MAFKPHVDLIVDTASAIAQSDNPQVSFAPGPKEAFWSEVSPKFGVTQYIFCSGGFGDSPYLRERLETIQGGVQIVQPEQTASSS